MGAAEWRRQESWRRLGKLAPIVAIGGFITLAIYAKWNPVQAETGAGQASPLAQKADAKGKGKKKQADPVKTTPVKPTTLRPIPGTGKKLDYHEIAKIIDEEVDKRMVDEGYKPSPRSDDAEFLRRIYLDLVGVIPSAEKVDSFLSDTDSKKREKVIDELLADPRFGKFLAETWTNLLLPRESNNRLLDQSPLLQWLAKDFNDGVPLNKIVFDLVTASGTTEENGAATYFVANPTVDKITDNVSRMFLGVQLQCAQCHNHPFTDWKQTEYWGMAAFFMKTKPTILPQMAAKKGVSPGVAETNKPNKAVEKKFPLPDSAKIVPAKFLQGETPRLAPSEPYRPVLAKWMTAPSNPFFARAMVNRFWYQLFGRGLVNPVDDMHQDNPPSHPELLAALTEQFKSSNFDLKHLLRAICNSETYQRTSKPTEDNKSDERFLSHRVVRVLSPEQFFDSLVTVVGGGFVKKAEQKAFAAGKKGPAGPRQNFVNFFRVDEGADPLEYQVGIPQALRLMNFGPFNNTTETVITSTKEGNGVPAKVIERLYLHALSRTPTAEETERMLQFMRKQGNDPPRAAYGDMLWALVNSSEFAVNH